ncbi:histidine phosphatase family protein [Rubrolithibacter danxiaensis]|uniref:histidine phosphatase family protein n=1 Tax=Rubrolithibacter danxiaensis TaxID=3390805 RepID=UPI003BF8248C
MKNFLYLLLFLVLTAIQACKDDKRLQEPSVSSKITSPEYEKELLFVNDSNFKIKTSEPATFASNDPHIQISADGVIKRLTSGEIAAIDIKWTNQAEKTTRIYAVGATDNSYDEPNVSFNGKEATDCYNSYRKGWETLRHLPSTDDTYAIILRHADADNGRDYSSLHDDKGPANWWKSCSPSLARQLNEQGKERAVALGKIFKDLKFPISRVISSEFCRAKSTAELINAGPAIKVDGRVNHPAYNVSGASLFNGMIEIMKEQPVDNKMTLLVAHHPINEDYKDPYPTFPGVSPFPWTGAYLIKIAKDKTITYEGAVSWAMFKCYRDMLLKK